MKKTLSLLLCTLLLALCLPLFTGCNNTMKILDGRWYHYQSGDAARKEMVDAERTVYVDMFADRTVTMYGLDLGTFTIDRNTFDFNSTDGKYHYSGSFEIEYPYLYIYLDDKDACYSFVKTNLHDADGEIIENTAAPQTSSNP